MGGGDVGDVGQPTKLLRHTPPFYIIKKFVGGLVGEAFIGGGFLFLFPVELPGWWGFLRSVGSGRVGLLGFFFSVAVFCDWSALGGLARVGGGKTLNGREGRGSFRKGRGGRGGNVLWLALVCMIDTPKIVDGARMSILTLLYLTLLDLDFDLT